MTKNNYYVGLLIGVLTVGILQGSGGEENLPELDDNQTHVYKHEENTLKEKLVKRKLDPYSMQIVSQQMGYVKSPKGKRATREDLLNIVTVNKKFENILDRNLINVIPVTEENRSLFPEIQTQQIFGPDDYIIPGLSRYIIIYPVTGIEIEDWVNKLQNKYNQYENGLVKPIVFKAQKFETRTICPIVETQDFEIKSYWCNINTGNRRVSVGKYYRQLENYNKPIVFGKTEKDLEFGTGVKVVYYEREVSYRKYLDLVQTYHNNFFVEFVKIETTSTEELKEQLDVLIKSKNVNQIRIDYDVDAAEIPLEYLGCIKIREMSFSNYQNPNGELFLIRTIVGDINNVKCKSIYCFEAPYPVGNTIVNRIYERIGVRNSYELSDNQRKYIGNVPEEVNKHLHEKERAYIQYIKNHDLEYLSGYVNVDNKPAELSDDEWSKVIILKGKAEEIKALMRYEQLKHIIVIQMQ